MDRRTFLGTLTGGLVARRSPPTRSRRGRSAGLGSW